MKKVCSAVLIFMFIALPISSSAKTSHTSHKKPIPVILDTDIGGDIDDTWALALLLKSPELDLKMVLTDNGDTVYRARVAAKLLEAAKRTDVPVAVGQSSEKSNKGLMEEWVKGYQLSHYPGKVDEDGIQAFIDLVMASPQKITLIAIGPVPNLAIALKKEPRIAKKLRFVGMFGSIAKGYGGKAPAEAEWNVKGNVPPCQKVFQAAWPMTITPLDTCGLVRLTGSLYQKVPKCQDPLIRALMDSYRVWAKVVPWEKGLKPDVTSSTLYDTVAVYLAFSEKWIEMKEMGIRVTDDGFTKVDKKAKKVRVALNWKDLEAFKTFLVERLTGNK